MKNSDKTRIGGLSIEEGIMINANGKTAFAMRLNDNEIHCKVDTELKRNLKKIPILNTLEDTVLLLAERTYYSAYAKFISLNQIKDKISNSEKEFIKAQKEKGNIQAVKSEYSFFGYLKGIFLIFFLISVTDIISSYLNFSLELRPVVQVVLRGLFGWAIYMGGVRALNDSLKPYTSYAHHSAEHKAVYCYKNSQELTLENLRNAPSFIKNCGTIETVIRFFLSLIFYLILPWHSFMNRFILELAFYPLVIYISRGIYRYTIKNDNKFVDLIIKFPSKYQKLTLREASDDMLMLAKSALEATFGEETTTNLEDNINLENYRKILKKELS